MRRWSSVGNYRGRADCRKRKGRGLLLHSSKRVYLLLGIGFADSIIVQCDYRGKNFYDIPSYFLNYSIIRNKV